MGTGFAPASRSISKKSIALMTSDRIDPKPSWSSLDESCSARALPGAICYTIVVLPDVASLSQSMHQISGSDFVCSNCQSRYKVVRNPGLPDRNVHLSCLVCEQALPLENDILKYFLVARRSPRDCGSWQPGLDV